MGKPYNLQHTMVVLVDLLADYFGHQILIGKTKNGSCTVEISTTFWSFMLAGNTSLLLTSRSSEAI